MKKENALYTDEQLVALYDTLNQWGEDNEFYFNLAGVKPIRILDAGCGTGILTVNFAEAGHDVVGIDPASKMLDVAVSRENGHLVDWKVARLQEFESSIPFDLIVMTGHAFQCLITDNNISEAFKSVSNLLTLKGCFVFESRNPDARIWENWTPEKSTTTGLTSHGLKFEVYHDVVTVEEEKVTFEERYTIEGKPASIVSRSTLRFAPLHKIEELAIQKGLIVDMVLGDWDYSKLEADSPELIVKVKRA